MSKFLSEKLNTLTAYTPGEQPKDMQYIKLNTNESPFPPPKSVADAVNAQIDKLQLYSDPNCSLLTEKASKIFGVKPSQMIFTNGSDEILNFAFMAFCDENHGVVFPDITYGFYSVFAKLYNVPYQEIPLKEDFSIDCRQYLGVKSMVVIANPNAPTGICLSLKEVEEIVKSNPENVVVIDEAYVDFGGESAIKLIDKYDNLLVTQTFSKSRSLAGARLGVGFAAESLIKDLQTIKYSTNPYNVNKMTMTAGYTALCENKYFMDNVKIICQNREYTAEKLREMGFEVLPSKTNFLFVQTDKIDGESLYVKLKQKGILVRHFSGKRIVNFNRITIGTKEQMDALLQAIKEIIG